MAVTLRFQQSISGIMLTQIKFILKSCSKRNML